MDDLSNCIYFGTHQWDDTIPLPSRQLQKYYMFPADTEREAMALLHTLWESLQ